MEIPNSPDSQAQAGFFRRKDFPDGFVFGTATSAFQVEGALKAGGRDPSIWDHYSEDKNLFLPYNADAVGHYKRYKEDVSLMKAMGFDAYRFSISWSRVMKNGTEENVEGIKFYDNLLQELHDKEIEPFVTLFHFDTPQALEDKYGSFLNRQIIEDFKNYADLCFRKFGPKVKNWITFNEPITFCMGGYLNYNMAPGDEEPDTNHPVQKALTRRRLPTDDLQAPLQDDKATGKHRPARLETRITYGGFLPIFGHVFFECRARSLSLLQNKMAARSLEEEEEEPHEDTVARDATKDPYTVAHNILLSHAKAVKQYKEKYQKDQKGQIGITLCSYWLIPYSDLPKDRDATQRAMDFVVGWFMDPLATGDYPESMRSLVTDDRLPEFNEEESNMVKGSFDFIGMNYYTSRYVSDDPYSKGGNYTLDPRATLLSSRDGVLIGENSKGLDWFCVYPKGIKDLLIYMDIKYNSPLVYVTENGCGELDDGSLSYWDALCDYRRLSFYQDHLANVLAAIQVGANVKGYFAWSLLDNFEWSSGYTMRFGITYVDYKNDSKRVPKLSGRWFKYLLTK